MTIHIRREAFFSLSMALMLLAGCTRQKNQEVKGAGASSNRVEQVKAEIGTLQPLPESTTIDRLITSGLTKAISKKGREVSVFLIRVPNGDSMAYRSSMKDLPEVIELQAGSRATMGWNWQTRPGVRGPEDMTMDSHPVGALLRLDNDLSIEQNKLPKGTLLQYSGSAWAIIIPADAKKNISKILALPDPLKDGTTPDAREGAALGTVLLGDQKMVTELLSVAERDDNVAPYASIALARIADSSVATQLEALAKRYASNKDVSAELQKALTRLNRK